MSTQMDSCTTLTTFLLQTARNVKSVHLVGSWDNFTKIYLMEKDSRKGTGHWRGCHTFENIMCDGLPDGRKRDGGLRMGGTYWYFYRLDGDGEHHDPSQPFTTACPLLPGQPVNILEVPFQLGPGRKRRRSGSASSVASGSSSAQTLNPAGRFMAPRVAPSPIPSRGVTSPSSVKRPIDEFLASTSAESSWLNSTRTRSPTPSVSTVTFTSILSASRKLSVEVVRPSVKSFHHKKLAEDNVLPHSRNGSRYDDRQESGDRRRNFGKKNEVEDEIDISHPVLISRTDNDRQCVPLSDAHKIARKAPSSQPTDHGSPRRVSPARDRAAATSRTPSPLRSCPVRNSRGLFLDRSKSAERAPAPALKQAPKASLEDSPPLEETVSQWVSGVNQSVNESTYVTELILRELEEEPNKHDQTPGFAPSAGKKQPALDSPASLHSPSSEFSRDLTPEPLRPAENSFSKRRPRVPITLRDRPLPPLPSEMPCGGTRAPAEAEHSLASRFSMYSTGTPPASPYCGQFSPTVQSPTVSLMTDRSSDSSPLSHLSPRESTVSRRKSVWDPFRYSDSVSVTGLGSLLGPAPDRLSCGEANKQEQPGDQVYALSDQDHEPCVTQKGKAAGSQPALPHMSVMDALISEMGYLGRMIARSSD